MQKYLLFSVLLLSVVALTACAGVGGYTQPAGIFPAGAIFTDTTSGSQVYENGVRPTKTGKACGTYILFVGTGDTSVETAMNNGGIKKLVFVTQSIRSILGPLYGEICTIARGT